MLTIRFRGHRACVGEVLREMTDEVGVEPEYINFEITYLGTSETQHSTRCLADKQTRMDKVSELRDGISKTDYTDDDSDMPPKSKF